MKSAECGNGLSAVSEEDSSIRWALGVHLNAHLCQVTPKPNKTVFMKSDLMGKQDCGRLLI